MSHRRRMNMPSQPVAALSVCLPVIPVSSSLRTPVRPISPSPLCFSSTAPEKCQVEKRRKRRPGPTRSSLLAARCSVPADREPPRCPGPSPGVSTSLAPDRTAAGIIVWWVRQRCTKPRVRCRAKGLDDRHGGCPARTFPIYCCADGSTGIDTVLRHPWVLFKVEPAVPFFPQRLHQRRLGALSDRGMPDLYSLSSISYLACPVFSCPVWPPNSPPAAGAIPSYSSSNQ